MRILNAVGCFISGQTRSLVPADRVMYALRDVTATVPSLPLVLASIVSKKLAEGAEVIVFDVKAGSGSFTESEEAARELATRLVRLCAARGRRAAALVTDMRQPLGNAVGNALEIAESAAVLQGGGPRDVRELTLRLGARMLELAGTPSGESRPLLENKLASGAAYEKFIAMVTAQGGAADVLEKGFPAARRIAEVAALETGYIAAIDAGCIGRAALALEPLESLEDLDEVGNSEPVALLHAGAAADLEAARALFLHGLQCTAHPPAPRPLVLEASRED